VTDSDSSPDASADPLAVVHDLVAFPPLHDADLRARTRSCETAELVVAIEEAVEDADDELEESRLLELLARLEPDHEWVADAAEAGSESAAPPLRELPPDVEATLTDQVGHLVESPRDATAIAATVARLPASLQAGLLARLDRVRAQSGVPAPLLFGPLLEQPLTAEVRAVIDEALAKDAQRPRRVEGFAWLASCDGTGAVSCFLGLRNPDTTHTVVHAVVRVDGGIVDAAVMARQSKKAVERLLDDARVDGIDFARAPVELVARLVADAAERGHARGATLSSDAEQALALLAPIALAPRPPRSAPLVIAMPPEPVEALFRRGEYVSWFLDAGELLDAGVAPPRGGSGGDDESAAEEWVEKALPKLDRAALRERLSAMAAYMGLWHELRRETQLAALLRALAWPATTSFVGDAVAELAEPEKPCGGAPANELFFGLVARSYFLAREQLEPPSVAGALGDPEVRQGIKERLFATTVAPSGRDLARLDLAELFLALFDATLAVVAPARRPDAAGRDALALRLADAVIAARGNAAAGKRTPLVETLATALRGEGSKLTAGDAAALAEQLVPALTDEFLKATCAACPIDCWSKLDADAATPFFATHHPAAEALDELAAEEEDERGPA